MNSNKKRLFGSFKSSEGDHEESKDCKIMEEFRPQKKKKKTRKINEISMFPLFHSSSLSNVKQQKTKMTQKMPEFKMDAVWHNKLIAVSSSDLQNSKQWCMIVFYKCDFETFDTDLILAFSQIYRNEKSTLNTILTMIGISIDSKFVHLAWTRQLKQSFNVDLAFPIASDIHRRVSQKFGVLCKQSGQSQRYVFIVDPHLTIRHSFAINFSMINANPKMEAQNAFQIFQQIISDN